MFTVYHQHCRELSPGRWEIKTGPQKDDEQYPSLKTWPEMIKFHGANQDWILHWDQDWGFFTSRDDTSFQGLIVYNPGDTKVMEEFETLVRGIFEGADLQFEVVLDEPSTGISQEPEVPLGDFLVRWNHPRADDRERDGFFVTSRVHRPIKEADESETPEGLYFLEDNNLTPGSNAGPWWDSTDFGREAPNAEEQFEMLRVILEQLVRDARYAIKNNQPLEQLARGITEE